MPKIHPEDRKVDYRFFNCEQCDRPLGYARYRIKLKDDTYWHVLCLEYIMRETSAWPGGPKIAHHLESRAAWLKKYSLVQQVPRRARHNRW